jgi:hypothetical protein
VEIRLTDALQLTTAGQLCPDARRIHRLPALIQPDEALLAGRASRLQR